MYTQEFENCLHFFDSQANEDLQSAIEYPRDPLIRIRNANVYFLSKKEIAQESSRPISIDCYNVISKTRESLLSFLSCPTDIQVSSKQNTLVVASPNNMLEAYDITSKNIKWRLNLLSLKLCSQCLQIYPSDMHEKLYLLNGANGMVRSIDLDYGLHLDTCTIKDDEQEKENSYRFLSVAQDQVFLQKFDLSMIHEAHQ